MNKRAGGGGNFSYEFCVEGKMYKGENAFPRIVIKKGYSLVSKTFPVAYERGNADNCELLMSPQDFEVFNLPFPDSLEWIRDCFFTY